MGKTIKPLSGRGNDINYEFIGNEIKIKWGGTRYSINKELIDEILNDYFIDEENWYSLGASMDNPIKGGLGEYLLMNHGLSPRYASVIGAIMYECGLVNFRGKRKIDLKKIV